METLILSSFSDTRTGPVPAYHGAPVRKRTHTAAQSQRLTAEHYGPAGNRCFLRQQP